MRERRAKRFIFRTAFSPDARDWEAMVAPIFGGDGEVLRLIVVSREITERNRLVAELHQAQKMEVIGQLAAGVSHDFNNILQVVESGVEVLKDERWISERGHTFLDMLERAVCRGANLTHHLLCYSRRQPLDPKPFDLPETLERLCDVLSRTIGSHICLTTEFVDPVGWVNADLGQFESALMNLAINASHAMPAGGTLHFCVRSEDTESVGELASGRYVVIAVTDNGTGMAPDVMDQIFDPFFTIKGLNGTGLGLAMVQGFCRQSGGDVRVTSKLGEGSCFEIRLPEIVVSAPRGSPADDVHVVARNGNVLLVDDAPDVLIMLATFLDESGFTVRQAKDGQQALAAFAAGERFDVMVTDYMMPGMSGRALIQQARFYQSELPALVISGFADMLDFLAGLHNASLLHKPFQRDELIAQVNGLLAETLPQDGVS